MLKNTCDNVLSFLENQTDKYRNKIALGMRSEFGWSEFSYDGLSKMSKKIAYFLINNFSIKREERIAIISQSKIEYGAVYFASIIAGTTLVPVDIKLTENEMFSILSNSTPSVVFVSKEYLERAIYLKDKIQSIKEIILLDNINHEPYNNYKNIYQFKEEETKFRHRSLNSTALIIYTSGTTGNPKGVEITFKNLIFQVRDLSSMMDKILKNRHDVRILSILPMNHLFELSFGFAAFLNSGYSIYYTKSLRPSEALKVMREKRICFMCTVPSFFRVLKTQFESELEKSSKIDKMIFKIKYHIIAKFLPFNFLKKRMFKNIHEKFGNSFYGFLSGGAPMDLAMGKYFNRIGINVFQGYGLSEATPVITVNIKKGCDIRSVGKLLDSFEAKVDPETGELLVKGPCVMKGYYKQPELTKQTIDKDNWLHTGDIAKIDKKGQVFIVGRIKNMIVLAGGKKVFPEEIEAILNKDALIKEAAAFGQLRKNGEKKGSEEVVTAVRAIDELYEKYDNKTVEDLIKAQVKKDMLVLAQYKRPTTIIVLKEEFPKTATKKIKRKELKELLSAK